MQIFPYRADGLYRLRRVRNPDTGEAVTGGSGSVTWYPDNSETPISGSANPVAISWNGPLARYESPISKDFETELGQIIRGEIIIDAADGHRYTDVIFARVRAPSSSGPTP